MNHHVYCMETKRLENKHVLITGASTGLGLETTAELARRGAIVHMAGHSLRRLEISRQKIMLRYGDLTPESCNNALESNIPDASLEDSFTPIENHQLVCHHLDLSCLDSVRLFVKKFKEVYKRLDILINNAAISNYGEEMTTLDLFEYHIQVNYLGHFLLTELLIDILERSNIARVIDVSSEMHKFSKYDQTSPIKFTHFPTSHPFSGYTHSKLACVLHTKEFNHQHPNKRVICICVRPNFASTNLHKRTPKWIHFFIENMPRLIRCSEWEAIQTTLHCCLTDHIQPGGYYEDCHLAKCNPQAEDDEFREIFWNETYNCVLGMEGQD